MATHPELAAEQAYIDHAYACLERARADVERLRILAPVGQTTTMQSQLERDVIEWTVTQRLNELELGEASLVFGRIDRERPEGDGTEAFYIGRVAVADEQREPVVVDWRAPVAEPFYRATGRDPMGLLRRRHFITQGRRLLGIEDELFDGSEEHGITGYGALLAALEAPRSGKLRDVVATIQAEQDEIIRAPLNEVLVVQGGPGTGKTVVALHRAAYLLYTHRFPLESQGVLVVGPNRLFLGYIDRVLPSLGEAGVELAVLEDLLAGVRIRAAERPEVAAIKGDVRMAEVLRRAIRDRERPLRADLEVGFGAQRLRLTTEESARIVRAARRHRHHNAGRRTVEREVFAALARTARREVHPDDVRRALRGTEPVRAALEWMWPVLTPAQLLVDLFGSRALLRSAGRGLLSAAEIDLLHREPTPPDDAPWTLADVPLLDEALELLGPPPGTPEEELPRTYGHIIVDEAQDLSPMALRMIGRRSMTGSMTVVGDIAQATGPWAPSDWDDILAHLPDRRPVRRRELTLGYRVPDRIMAVARVVLAHAAPGLEPPRSVREGEHDPERIEVSGDDVALADAVARRAAHERDIVGEGNVAVICPASLVSEVGAALDRAGIDHGEASRSGLRHPVTVVPVGLAKGLELDAIIVVEPHRIVTEEHQGPRALYVALTRATQRLTVVHRHPLPYGLADHLRLVDAVTAP